MATTTTEVARNGEGEQKRREKGGFKTMPFILGNDICDRFATAGFNANLITYLTKQLHLPLVPATNLLNNFGGTSSLTSILGALAADSFAGRFWTIIAGSVFYQLGMVGLVVSALLPSLRPSPCSAPLSGLGCQRASGLQLTVLYLSLLHSLRRRRAPALRRDVRHRPVRPAAEAGPQGGGGAETALLQPLLFHDGGSGAAGSDGGGVHPGQRGVGVGVRDPGHRHVRLHRGVRDRVPAVRPAQTRGQPVHTSRAGRRRRVQEAQHRRTGGHGQAVPGQGARRPHRHHWQAAAHQPAHLIIKFNLTTTAIQRSQQQIIQHRFLDRAAIVTPGDISDSGQPDLWRLSTVHRVEELKSIVRMLPIWSAGILMTTVESHTGSFLIIQALTMDRHITRHFEIPAATMSIFGIGSYLISLALYDRAFVPLARRVTGLQSGITYFQRMGIGLAIHILGIGTAAVVETKRRHTAADNGFLDNPTGVIPLSVFWLVPQFAVNGLAGAFSGPGHMEFLYDQSPESMRSTAAALFWLSGSFGSYLGTVLVTVVQRTTRARGNDWLQDNINRGRIDNYYWLVTCLMVLNLGYFLFCFRFYTMKPLEMADKQDDHDGEYELSTLQKNDTGAGGVV